LWILAVPLLCLRATPAAAQFARPRIGQFEIYGLDFRPDGAWRKQAAAVRANRRGLIRSGNVAALNAPGFQGSPTVVAGNYKVPVLLIDFPNSPGPFPATDYDSVLFAENPGLIGRPYSTRSYYEELSNGLVHISGVVHDWIHADSADSYYEQNCNAIFCNPPTRFAALLLATLDSADDGTLDWSQFDGDGDGVVDFVTFIHSDVDGACGSSHIWAHRYYIGALTGAPYVTKTPWPGHAGQFIKIDSYTIQSGLGGSTACNGGQIMPIGIITHETGHAFGLPDLYDTGNPAGSEGIGEWGLMGSSGYTTALSPGRFDAWSAAELGWVKIDTLGSSRSVDLGPVQSSDTVLYAAVPGTDEYFYFENRASLESDTAQMNPAFPRHKQPGLLIWHLDQGQIDTHGINADNQVNALLPHGVALMQADGLGNLDKTPGTAGSNRGDPGDAYPGSSVNRRYSYTTTPAALSNAGLKTGWIVDAVSDPVAGTQRIQFNFIKQAASVVAANPATAPTKVNGVSRLRFEDIVPNGQTLALDVVSPQVLNNGRTRLTFTSWSDGGLQSHNHVAGAQPDTTIATFGVENRVLLTAVTGSGTGTVAASVPGTLATGIYVAAGTPVTLTATADAGSVFSGWVGDTTASNAALQLGMARGYSVTATFTGAVAVVFTDATAEILGVPTLTTQQKTYLDQLGNKNGSYDLGDFLALQQRTGGAMPPAVAAKLHRLAARKEH
jgi:M6 family metalloprotease-like protein